MIFADESHFEVRGHKSAVVGRSKGEDIRPEHIQQTPKHPPKKMFWGSFTAKGPGRLIVIEGMMKSDKYKATLHSYLLPVLERDFADGNCIFQQDLAPCHTSKKMRTFFEEKDITILDWSGNSPDLNSIENLWAVIKSRIEKTDCLTAQKLISANIRTSYHDDEIVKVCSTLVDSMPKRVKMLIKAKGGHISY